MAFGGFPLPSERGIVNVLENGELNEYQNTNGTRAALARGDVIGFVWHKAGSTVTLKIFVNGTLVDTFDPGPAQTNGTGKIFVAKKTP